MREQLAVRWAAGFLICAAMAAAAEQEAKPTAEVKEELLRVPRGDLDVRIEADANIEPARRKKLKILPDEFVGPYTIVDIVPSGTTVDSGAVLLKLDTVPLERFIRAAREGLDGAKLKAQTTREDADNLKLANRLKGERMQQEIKLAEQDVKIFDKYGEEQLLKGRDLGLKQHEYAQSNRENELAQLEKMYRDSQVAGQTKEIVLERARREVDLGRIGLKLAQRGADQLKEFDHATTKEKIARAAEQKRQDYDVFKVAANLAEILKAEEVKAAERVVRDAQERLARLDSDLALLTCKAPFAGVFRHGGLEAGDKLNPNVAFADLLDAQGTFEARLMLTLKDIHKLRVGDSVSVTVPDLPEYKSAGKIEEISWTATVDDKGGPPRYMVRVSLEKNDGLRHGVRGRLEFRGEKLKDVVWMPRSAVVYEDGRTYARIRTDAGIVRREVALGQGDRERVHVLRGLNADETLVVKEARK